MANNLVTGENGKLCIASSSFAAAGLTSSNCTIVQRIGDGGGSWKPTRSINLLTTMTEGEVYRLKMLSAADLSAVLAPPLNNNVTPAAPTVTGDDTANTLTATHTLGAGEIEYSTNDGSFAQYTGAISVGDVNRASGYYKFRTKAASGRNVSATANSPQFTVAGSPLHYSTFTAADNTVLSSYTPETGAAWQLGPGSWKIVSNKAITEGSAGTSNNYSAKTPIGTTSNYKVTAVAETTTNGMYRQILLKMNTGETDGVVINISEAGTDVIELIAGTPTTTSFKLPSSANNGLTSASFEVSVSGTTLTLKKDGVSYVKTDDSGSSATIGTHAGTLFGIGNANTSTITAGAVKFDSFRVENI